MVGFHSSVTNNLSGGGYQVAISIDSVEGLSWGSINVEGKTLPLEMRKNMYIAFLIHKRYIPDPEQLNQQRFKCAAQMREPL